MNTLPPTTPALARVVNGITSANHQLDAGAYAEARGAIPGWSQPFHFTFFGHILAALCDRPRILVCGVYRGLDLALITHAAKLLGKEIALTGVDLFSAEPCADWPAEKRHLTWEQAFNCAPPSIEAARRNAPGADIIQASSIDYLRAHAQDYDFIYLDTSHDEQTVCEEIGAIRSKLRTQLVAGDDYHQPGTCWGVDRAVTRLFPSHVVFFNRIWLAQL
jgi:hypothetical protein